MPELNIHGRIYVYVCVCVCLCVCARVRAQGSPADIQTPAHWNLNGRSMTASPPVIAQQYYSATLVSSCSFRQGRIQMLFFYFLETAKVWNCQVATVYHQV
jgi:hypothetical protein